MSRYQLGLPGIITGLACMFSGGRVVLSVCITTFRPECPKCGDNPAPSLVRYLNRIEMNVRHFLRCVNIFNDYQCFEKYCRCNGFKLFTYVVTQMLF